jgi:hypothetical protein
MCLHVAAAACAFCLLLALLLLLQQLLVAHALTLAGLHQVLHISDGGIGPHLKEVGLPCTP